jgi:hypothetical protein
MTRTKILISTSVAIIFLAVQVIAVGAAPAAQDTAPITGTIVQDGISLEMNSETGVTTVVVTLIDETGTTQTVRMSLEDAALLGLVMDDGAGNLIPDDTKYDTMIEIDPATAIPDETDATTEEPQHPVGLAISDFFSEFLGVDYETVMDYHDEGAGFGVIAQALWMTNALDGDSETFTAIMQAKQTKDYSGIALPDGSTPQNWGQFRKAVMSDREKAKENLGAIMSGRAENPQNQATQPEIQNDDNAPGNGNGNALGNGNSNNGNAFGNGNENNNGSNGNAPNNNGNGNNKDKNKDKNKNKDKGKNKDK